MVVKIYGSGFMQKIQARKSRCITVTEIIDPNSPRFERGRSKEHNRVDCFGEKISFQGKPFYFLL